MTGFENPKDAREYIAKFHEIAHMPSPLMFVDFPSRRIRMADMTDDEAVIIANDLLRMEAEGNSGRKQ